MRTLLFATAFLLLAASPAAAQMPSESYVFRQVTGPTAAQLPGANVQFNFTAERVCGFQGDILPATTARVDFTYDGNLTVAGPGQVQFPQQVCASQSTAVVTFQATVAVLASAEARTYKLGARLTPESNGVVPHFSAPATVDFLLNVQAPAPAAKITPEAKASPGAAPVFLIAVLALAALAMRRQD